MPRRPRREVETRLREVERALLTLPWTLDTQRLVADRHGVSDRQVRDDARIVRERWAEDARQTKPDESKADWLQRLRMAQHRAQEDGQSIALGRLLALEARAMGYESPINVNVNHTAQQLDPVSQARAIVEHYDAARSYLEAVGDPLQIIEVEHSSVDG